MIHKPDYRKSKNENQYSKSKGNNVRSMDKHHKFNHSEYKIQKQIDNKFEILDGGRFNPKDFQK